MSECNHDCSSCASSGNCSEIQKAKLNDKSNIKKVVGVLSGKGGVGKSFVTSMLAVELARKGYKVGILDADITGPSIPKAFGIKEKAMGEDGLIYPAETRLGIKVISANMLLSDDNEPIVWRGVLLGNLVKQFFEDVYWGDLDYLLIDMPPGTGDVALTIFQILPVDDLIIVTSPQDLVSMIVTKAIRMAKMMKINILGVVENMSYIKCPQCNTKVFAYGVSHLDDFAKEAEFSILGKLPLVTENLQKVDSGNVEEVVLPEFGEITSKVEGE